MLNQVRGDWFRQRFQRDSNGIQQCMDNPKIAWKSIVFANPVGGTSEKSHVDLRCGEMHRSEPLILLLPSVHDSQEFGNAIEAVGPIGAGCANELVDYERTLFCVGHSLSIRRGKRCEKRVPQRLSVFRHSWRQRKRAAGKPGPPFFGSLIAEMGPSGAVPLQRPERCLVHAAHAAWA